MMARLLTFWAYRLGHKELPEIGVKILSGDTQRRFETPHVRAIGPNQGSSLRQGPGHVREIGRKDVNKALDVDLQWIVVERSVMLIRLALFVYFVTLHGVRVV